MDREDLAGLTSVLIVAKAKLALEIQAPGVKLARVRSDRK